MGLSSYWFASSAKWYILLLAVLPSRVEEIVGTATKEAQWGRVVAAGAIWAIIGPAFFGYLSDKLHGRGPGRSKFLLWSVPVTILGLVTLFAAHSIPLMMVGYFILQVGEDMGTGPFNAVIPELVVEEQRGRASGMMGFMQLGAQLFIGLFAFGAGLLLKSSATLAIYAFLIVINIAFSFWAARTIQATEPLPLEQPTEHVSLWRAWLSPWKSADFRWVWFTRFLVAVGFYLIVTYLKFFLGDVVYHSAEVASKQVLVLGLAMSLAGAIGSIVAGKFADRVGRKRVIYLAGTVMAGILIPPIILPLPVLMLPVAAIFGAAYGAYLSADWALASDILPNKGQEGTDMGVWHASVPSTQIVAGLFGVVITELNEKGQGMGYKASFAIAAWMLLLGSILVRQVKGSS